MKIHLLVFISLLLTQTAFCQNIQYKESDIKVYLNNIEIIGPIYTSKHEIHIFFDGHLYSEIISTDNVSIKLVNIFPLIETEINIRDNINERFKLLADSTEFTDEEQRNIFFNHIINELDKRNELIIINNEYYIDIFRLTALFNSISRLPSNIGNNGISIYLRGFEY